MEKISSREIQAMELDILKNLKILLKKIILSIIFVGELY